MGDRKERKTGEAARAGGQKPTGMGGIGGVTQGVGGSPQETAGGGGIGVGNAPTAGEAGFTGNLGGPQEIG